MKIRINNEVDIEVDDLRVYHNAEAIGEDEEDGQLEIHVTGEGVMMDVWVGDNSAGTSSETFDEIVTRLVEGE